MRRVGDEGKDPHHHPDGAADAAGLRHCFCRPMLAWRCAHHARHRSVQKHLADQPLMQAVLADMALHVDASIALVRGRAARSTRHRKIRSRRPS
jgi:hypothetical protein